MLKVSLTRQQYQSHALAAALFKAIQSFDKQYTSVSIYVHELNAESEQYSCHASNAPRCSCVAKDADGLHAAACSLVPDSLWQTCSQMSTTQFTNICIACRLLVESVVAAAPSHADHLGRR